MQIVQSKELSSVDLSPLAQQATLAQLLAVVATDSKLEAVRALLAGTLTFDKTALSTSALQATGNATLGAIDTKLGTQATAAAQEAQRLLLAGLASEAKLEAVRSLLAGTLNIDKANLSTSALQTAGNATLATLATDSKLEAVRALLAGTLTVQQSSTDMVRLRMVAARKTAFATITTAGASTVLAAPAVATHRHIICWLRVQNDSATDTDVFVSGNGSTIPFVCPAKGAGAEMSANPELFSLPVNTALTATMSVATTVFVSVGYFTVDANGAPV